MSLNDEIKQFHDEIEKRFGKDAVWLALFIIAYYDNKTKTIPECFMEDPKMKEIVEYIKNNDFFNKRFMDGIIDDKGTKGKDAEQV